MKMSAIPSNVPWSLERLRRWCTTPEERVEKLLPGLVRFGTPTTPYWFKDNGARILAVAHLDWVHAADHFEVLTLRATKRRKHLEVYSAALDDRLGAYVIAEVLPKLGVNADILFTTDEECAMSTGVYFDPPRQYDWLFSFDRAGNDVVGYQYQAEPAWQAAVKDSRLIAGHGSYSDIVDIDAGCLGFNFGVGYHDQHTFRCHAALSDVDECVGRFMRFHKIYAGVAMPYTPRPRLVQSTATHYTYFDWEVARDGKPVDWEAARDGEPADWVCERCGKAAAYYFDDLDETYCEVCARQRVKPSSRIYGLCLDCNDDLGDIVPESLLDAYPVCQDCLAYGVPLQDETAM
jgi:hypothetical protein